MTFECNFGRVNNDEIDQLQKEYSIILPDDYISFLKTYNGGVVRKSNENRVFVPDLSTHIALDVLYGVNTDSSGSDIRFWTSKFRKELLDKSIIIGLTFGMTLIILKNHLMTRIPIGLQEPLPILLNPHFNAIQSF